MQAIAIQADCAEPTTAAPRLVAEVVKKFGSRIDIIVNNAANGSDQTLNEVDREIFDTMFHTNVLFPLLLVKESVQYLSKGSRIVNISSSGARSRTWFFLPFPRIQVRSGTNQSLLCSHAVLDSLLGNQSCFGKYHKNTSGTARYVYIVVNHVVSLTSLCYFR